MRPLALLLAAAVTAPALADEVDLTPRSRRGERPPTLVLRGEGGTEFAPYGYAGACLSWLTESSFEFEAGAGGGFPGVQIGFATRRIFGERGSYLVTELLIAGNTKVNRGASSADRLNNVAGSSSLWGGLGFGFEQRQDFFSFSVVGSMVSTFSNPSLHFALHGGIGLGF
ncbi:MAG: hypothetical protein E6J78_10865 [Deltaproteobacteria bacterium]|nr:MAG: hypothetical protein E6J78_10865 [Deltaproteobacteria bacterium]